MKNIVILGASRAGKTTLAREICKLYPNYHLISGDSIRNAFQEALPQNNINKFDGVGMEEDFPRFCANYFRSQISSNKEYFNYIFDSCDVSVFNAVKYFINDDTIVIYIGYSNINEYEALSNYRKFEQDNDWTLKRTDEELLIHAREWINNSKKFKNECKKVGIKYIDTSFNRNQILKKLKEELIEEIENGDKY